MSAKDFAEHGKEEYVKYTSTKLFPVDAYEPPETRADAALSCWQMKVNSPLKKLTTEKVSTANANEPNASNPSRR